MGAKAFCLFLATCVGLSSGAALLEPKSGSYFGVSVDFATTTVAQYLTTTSISPAAWNVFVVLPMNSTSMGYLQQVLPQIAAAQAICLLTVEPMNGLDKVTPDAVQQLATIINQYQKAGASFMIRYAHEMNGNWFPWGQQPAEYIASHQMVTSILRNSSCGVAMVWAPNAAVGYPWAGGIQSGTSVTPALAKGSADFKALDTNGDGSITSADDPYLPYYPGDAWVDWVGMSSFHFGGEGYPFNKNQEAASNSFVAGFTGNGLSNFYSRFCNDTTHNKPMVITETSAMYNPSDSTGSTDFAIKQQWWQQVFNVQGDTATGPDISMKFPRIKAIMWFDEIKTEPQAANAVIDWRFSGVQQICSALAIYIQTPAKSTGQRYWLQLSDFTASNNQLTCNSTGGLTSASPAGSLTVPASSIAGGSTIRSQGFAPAASYVTSTTTRSSAQSPPAQATPVATPAVTRSSNNLAGLIGRRLR